MAQKGRIEPSVFEAIQAGILRSAEMQWARDLVSERGPEAFLGLIDWVRRGRVDQAALERHDNALLVAVIEAALGASQARIPLEQVLGAPVLQGYLTAKMDARRRGAEARGEWFDDAEAMPGQLRDIAVHWHLLEFHRAGRHAYEVSPGLAEKLAHTELRGLTAEDLRLPFPAISIHVPLAARLELDGRGPVPALPITEVYLVEDVVHGCNAWTMFVCGGEQRADAFGGHPATADMFLTIMLPEGGSLDECIRATSRTHARVGGMRGHLFDSDGMAQEHLDGVDWDPVFRWAMNVVVYATNGGVREEVWRNPEAAELRARIEAMPPESKTRRRLQGRLETMDQGRRIVLGPGVVGHLLDGGAGDGSPLLVRVRVQGHWRRQPHGPGRRERKLIWIEPFWRGPEDGPIADSPLHRLE